MQRLGFDAERRKTALTIACLAAIPLLVGLVSIVGPVRTDARYLYSGIAVDVKPGFLEGTPTIDGNMGMISQALGQRAAADVFAGRLPLWNHYQGLGAPLLGEMQSAALFPPTWLMLLPHGQALEQALLQCFAGVGTYLFLRRFGLGARAALAGGMAFEVNGVFAWLRNAIFNPVAVLPWLFLVVECLVAEDRPPARRLPLVGFGGAMAALALYAGFPEQVYLYGLLLIAWTVFRLCGVPLRRSGRVIADLVLMGLVAAALSAPLLVCFVDYLRVAELGDHVGQGFGGAWLRSAALVQTIMPYVYGQIFASADPLVVDIWNSTGGYIGFTPLVLCLASLTGPERRSSKLFLAAWIVLALGVTHGVPGLFDVIMRLPLMKTVAVFRYINASWIFCVIVLGALFLDEMARDASRMLNQRLGLAIGGALVLTASAMAEAWQTIRPGMAATSHSWLACLAAVAGVGLLAGVLGWQGLRGSHDRRVGWIAGAMILEASVWFAVPYLSYPRRGHLDRDLVAFLRDHAGFQRVLGIDAGSVYPNYGSAFGFSLLNYDDLPSPSLTAAYVKANLEPDATGIAYLPVPDRWNADRQAERLTAIHARLASFARAGVKFVLAQDGFEFVSPFDVLPTPVGAFALTSGQALDIRGRVAADMRVGVAAVNLRIDQIDRLATGHIEAALCVDETCVDGRGALAARDAESRLSVTFDHEVDLRPGAAFTLRIERPDGDGRIALPAFAPAPGAAEAAVVGETATAPAGAVPDIRFVDANVRQAYSGQLTAVYQLDEVRPYLSADGCRLDAATRDRVKASCPAPATLTRLEAALPGWSARVNGVERAVGTVDDAFQTVDLPAGEAEVEFVYSPRGLVPALAAAGAALVSILVVAGWAVWRPWRLVSVRAGRGARATGRSGA